MNTLEQSMLIGRIVLLVVATAAAFFPGFAISLQTSSPSSSNAHTQMSEALRTSIKKVVVLPGTSPTEETTIGSYGEATPGLLDGMQQGSENVVSVVLLGV